MEEDYYENQLKNLNNKYESLERQLEKGSKCIVLQMGSFNTYFGIAGESICHTITTSVTVNSPQNHDLKRQPTSSILELETNQTKPETQTQFNIDELYTQIISQMSLKIYEDKKTKLLIKESKPDNSFMPADQRMMIETEISHPQPINEHTKVTRYPIFQGNFNVSHQYPEDLVLSDILRIIEDVLHKCLKIPCQSLSEYDLVLIIPDNFNKKQYERLIELVFKKFNINGMTIQLESVMAAFANCLTVGLFVDIGFSKTTIIAMEEGTVIDDTLTVSAFGIKDILYIYESILAKKRNLDLKLYDYPQLLHAVFKKYGRFNYEIEESEEGHILLRKAKINIKQLDDGSTDEILLFLDDLIVSLNSLFVELPDFNIFPLDKMILDSVTKIPDEALRKKILLNIVVSGGLADLPGFSRELENRLIDRVGDDIDEVAVVEPEMDDLSKAQGCFLGGCILPKLDSYSDILIKRDTYLGNFSNMEKRTTFGKNYMKEKISFKW